MSEEQSLVERLRIRAKIRREIPHRKSVQEGKPDRLADLLDEAANEIQGLRQLLEIKSTDCRILERRFRMVKFILDKVK